MSAASASPDSPRPFPRWLVLVLVVAGVQLASNWFPLSLLTNGPGLRNILALEVLCWLGVWQLFLAARRADYPEEVRRALRWAILPILLQGLEGALLVLMELLDSIAIHGPTWSNFPLVASDVLGQGSEVAILVFLLKLPGAGRARRGTLRAVIDGLTFVVGAGVPLWLFSLKPLLAASTNVDDLFSVTGPLVSFSGLLILSWALETRAVLPNRGAYQLLLSAAGMLLLSDIIFSIGKTSGLQYSLIMRLNYLFLFVAFTSWLVAAWRFRAQPAGPAERRPLVAFSPLPMITIVAAASLFMAMVFLGDPSRELYPKLLAVFFLFLVILLAREIFVVRDSLLLVANEAERKTQARFEALVRHSTDFVLVVSADHRVAFASPATERVLGCPVTHLTGRNLLDFIHPEDRVTGADFLRRLAEKAERVETVPWRFVTPDGAVRHLETVGNNQLAEPDLAGLVLNSRDVSDRQQMEMQLRQSQKMDAIGQLAGGVAHDFNNILTAIQLQLELLRDDYARIPGLQAGLDELRDSAQRAAGLTRQLLTFGRRQIVQRQAVELDALLANLLKMLRRLIGENITIDFRPLGRGTWVTADPGMMEQVVLNLVVNARDAVLAGGNITLATGNVELADHQIAGHPERRAGRFVTIAVKDTGHGMEAGTLQRIFEPFFTTKEFGRGTGLGLATVYGIVKQHDGWIEVESAPGRGTQFTVHLPATDPAAATGGPTAAAAPAEGGRESILLVEDDQTVRNLAETVLRQSGYSVIVAGSGAEALERWNSAGAQGVSLLVTDMVMPGGMSGLDLALRLRRDRPELRVVVMSGYSQELSTAGLPAVARVEFLAKPFLSSGLLRAVRQALEKA